MRLEANWWPAAASDVARGAGARCACYPASPIERRYERFLVNERGLSRATVGNHLPIIHTFLAEHFNTRAVALETLSVCEVNQFWVRRTERWPRSRPSPPSGALRGDGLVRRLGLVFIPIMRV